MPANKRDILVQRHKDAVKAMVSIQSAYTQAVRKNKLAPGELAKLANKGFRAEAKALKALQTLKAFDVKKKS